MRLTRDDAATRRQKSVFLIAPGSWVSLAVGHSTSDRRGMDESGNATAPEATSRPPHLQIFPTCGPIESATPSSPRASQSTERLGCV